MGGSEQATDITEVFYSQPAFTSGADTKPANSQAGAGSTPELIHTLGRAIIAAASYHPASSQFQPGIPLWHRQCQMRTVNLLKKSPPDPHLPNAQKGVVFLSDNNPIFPKQETIK
jgi:hypothetical protein